MIAFSRVLNNDLEFEPDKLSEKNIKKLRMSLKYFSPFFQDFWKQNGRVLTRFLGSFKFPLMLEISTG